MGIIKKVRNVVRYLLLQLRYRDKIKVIGITSTHLLPKLHVAETGKIIIGDGLMAEKNVSIESYSNGEIIIGDKVFINSNTKIVSRKEIRIGEKTVIGPNVCIYDHDHDWKSQNMQGKYLEKPVSIGNNVWIGANSVILKGTRIGNNSVVAAGSVVNSDVPADSLLYQERQTRIKIKKTEEQRGL